MRRLLAEKRKHGRRAKMALGGHGRGAHRAENTRATSPKMYRHASVNIAARRCHQKAGLGRNAAAWPGLLLRWRVAGRRRSRSRTYCAHPLAA